MGTRTVSGALKPFVLLLISCATGCAYLADNMATVEPGEFYRSGQIPGRRLDDETAAYIERLFPGRRVRGLQFIHRPGLRARTCGTKR